MPHRSKRHLECNQFQVYRTAVFLMSPAVKHLKLPPLYSVPFIRLHGKKISTVIFEHKQFETYEVLLCQLSLYAITMPIISSNYATSSTSELVVSVQLP